MDIKQVTHELTKHAIHAYNNKHDNPYLINYDYIDLTIYCNDIKYKLTEVYEANIYYNTNNTITIIFILDAGYDYAETQLTITPTKINKFTITTN